MDRREFLKRSLVVGAGVASASSLTLLDPRSAHSASLSSCHLGAHALPRGTEKTQKDSTLALENQLGRTLGVMRRYSFWEDPPPDGTHLWAAQGGRIPYMSWHAYTRERKAIPWASIARGDHNTYIRRVAQGLADFGYPVYFAFHHEPENDTDNGGPADFRAAFERVRTIFHNVGTPNVTWVCTLQGNTYRGRHGGPDKWLPPKDYYRHLGSDGYCRFPLIDQPPWRSFGDLFDDAHRKAKSLGKKLFVGEFGCIEQTSGGYTKGDPLAKAHWFEDVSTTIQTWADLVAVNYSHAVAPFQGLQMPYWIDTTSDSLDAFKAMGAAPYFQ
jgi:hypothetical protein